MWAALDAKRQESGCTVAEANLALLRGDRRGLPTPREALIGDAPVPGRIQLFERNSVAKMERASQILAGHLGERFQANFRNEGKVMKTT